MNTDECVAVLKAAATADGGCGTCISGVVRQLVWELPDADWRAASNKIESRRDREAIFEGIEEAQELSPVDGEG